MLVGNVDRRAKCVSCHLYTLSRETEANVFLTHEIESRHLSYFFDIDTNIHYGNNFQVSNASSVAKHKIWTPVPVIAHALLTFNSVIRDLNHPNQRLKVFGLIDDNDDELAQNKFRRKQTSAPLHLALRVPTTGSLRRSAPETIMQNYWNYY